MVLLVHLYCDDHLALDGHRVHDLMAVDSTPGGNVMENTGICTGDFEQVAICQLSDFVLGSDNGHRAQQPSGIQFVLRHARILGSQTAGVASP